MKLSSIEDEKAGFSTVRSSSEGIVKTVALVVVVIALAGAQNLVSCVVIQTKHLNSLLRI